ncbi:hypothetical protein GPECTOR_844g82 [Gonium pectorale]|uniref:Uncharacterized protein n=1 Tax=Gonium pectorale TaxID=33097 RepID=A0A150FTX6_GONPE|nr:hypothetical protein GPECTOR_844g82 [Gonium pectorale]|eukprot:KXZ41073.1 hypothetical protein GPECTOR_844g82 [Gonium pectorale]
MDAPTDTEGKPVEGKPEVEALDPGVAVDVLTDVCTDCFTRKPELIDALKAVLSAAEEGTAKGKTPLDLKGKAKLVVQKTSSDRKTIVEKLRCSPAERSRMRSPEHGQPLRLFQDVKEKVKSMKLFDIPGIQEKSRRLLKQLDEAVDTEDGIVPVLEEEQIEAIDHVKAYMSSWNKLQDAMGKVRVAAQSSMSIAQTASDAVWESRGVVPMIAGPADPNANFLLSDSEDEEVENESNSSQKGAEGEQQEEEQEEGNRPSSSHAIAATSSPMCGQQPCASSPCAEPPEVGYKHLKPSILAVSELFRAVQVLEPGTASPRTAGVQMSPRKLLLLSPRSGGLVSSPAANN